MAAIGLTSPSSTIVLPDSAAPWVVRFGDFSLLAWVYLAEETPSDAAIYTATGLLEVSVQDGDLVVTGHIAGRDGGPLTCVVPGAVPTGEWVLLAVSYTRVVSRLEAWAVSQTGGLHGETVSGAFETYSQPWGVDVGFVTLGNSVIGRPGMVGLIGTLAIRSHTVKAGDVLGVFGERKYLSPYSFFNQNTGGNMTGFAGCRWMVGHAMTTSPIDYGVGGSEAFRSAVVDEPIGIGSFHQYDKTIELNTEADYLRCVRPLVAVGGAYHKSHKTPPYDGYFVPDTSTAGVVPIVPVLAPRAHQLVAQPRELTRIMTSGNSRAVLDTDGSGLMAGNFMHGLIEVHRAWTSGVLLWPARLVQTPSPWFGFDLSQQAPYRTPSDVLHSFPETNKPYRDFGRFFTGSGKTASTGPGAGVFLEPNSFVAYRCRSEAGSLLTSDAPLVVEAHVLAFPGASNLVFSPDRGPSQADAGVRGDPTEIVLDTKRAILTVTAADDLSQSPDLRFAGDMTQIIFEHDAIVLAFGAGKGSVGVVSGVRFVDGMTEVQLSHAFHTVPSEGDVLLVGPWSFQTLEVRHEPVPAGDAMTWRGMHIGLRGNGVGGVVFAMSAYRDDVPGFAFGAAGWGGNGYTPQIAQAFPGSIAGWAAMSRADVWLQGFAQQASSPGVMSTMAGVIREGLPDVELFWAGDFEHPVFTPYSWHTYASDSAGSLGVGALLPVDDPRAGTYDEQLSDGLRRDSAHYSHRGNTRVAQLWTELLADAALDPCSAIDFNADAWVNGLDIGLFLDAYSHGDLAADLNNDGQINGLDVGVLLAKYAECR